MVALEFKPHRVVEETTACTQEHKPSPPTVLLGCPP